MAAENVERLLGISSLIERIYAAATDPALWPEVLNDVGRAVSDGTQTLLFVAGREHLPGVLRCERTPDSVLFPFLDYYSTVNVLAEPCDRIFPDGTVRLSHVAVNDHDFERSEFYADFFRRNGLFYSCGIKHSSASGRLEYLSMQRERALDPFSPSETAVLELLMPHIRQALTIQAQLAAQANHVHAAQAALSAFGKAVLAIDAAGRLTFATSAAEALLRSADPLFLRAGRLCARDPRIDEHLQQRLHAVLGLTTGFAQSRGEALLVPQRNILANGKSARSGRTSASSGTDPADSLPLANSLKLVFLPMRHAGLLGPTAPGALLNSGALVAISGGPLDEPQTASLRHAGPRDAMLRDLFGLTPIEARIADLIGRGADVKSIAATLNKSEAATRFHLKQIFEKTGTTRQANLLRLLSELPRG